jgi:hypothetical protein
MAPQLRQMNVSYVDHEDRLMLRISNSEDEEYRIWCTRRFTRLVLDRFESEFQKEVVATAPVPQEARRDVAQMKHGQAIKEESFKQAYTAEPTEFPLGEGGVLATTLKYGINDKGVMSLNISDGKKKAMSLNLNQNLQHQFYELLRRAAEKAKWFDAPSATEVAASSGVVH